MLAGFYWEIDASQDHDAVVDNMARIMRVKVRPNAPRRPPRILLVGPPGSGKTTIGRLIAQRYGLIFVSTGGILSAEIANKTAIGLLASQLTKNGALLPDHSVAGLVESRLKASDCRVNGWVLEGFPKTEGQIHMLRTMKLLPSLTIELNIDDEVVFERHEYKKYDPETGTVYSLAEGMAPTDDEVLGRLVARDCDKLDVVKRRLQSWKDFSPKIGDAFKGRLQSINADKPLSSVTDDIFKHLDSPSS